MQIALAWVMRGDDVIAIPKASNPNHIEANRDAIEITLDDEDLEMIDQAFPPPQSKQRLTIL